MHEKKRQRIEGLIKRYKNEKAEPATHTEGADEIVKAITEVLQQASGKEIENNMLRNNAPSKKAEPATYRLAKNPYLVKSLDISTGHLTKLESDLLDDASKGESANPITAYKYEYGHNVHVPTEDTDYLAMTKYGYSPQFIAILRRAKELGCKYVQFDCDGIQYDDLDTFSW